MQRDFRYTLEVLTRISSAGSIAAHCTMSAPIVLSFVGGLAKLPWQKAAPVVVPEPEPGMMPFVLAVLICWVIPAFLFIKSQK